MWKEQFRDLHSGVLSTQSQNLSLHSFTSPPNQHRPSQHHFSSDHLPLSAAWSNLFLLLSHLALLPNSSQKKKKNWRHQSLLFLYICLHSTAYRIKPISLASFTKLCDSWLLPLSLTSSYVPLFFIYHFPATLSFLFLEQTSWPLHSCSLCLECSSLWDAYGRLLPISHILVMFY